MVKTWVQDAKKEDAENLCILFHFRNPFPRGSKYITGESKSKDSDNVGIYFLDPSGKE